MEKGKIIVMEGTDCSGKETQSKKLLENLENDGIAIKYFSFPNYNEATGKIVGISYLGKPDLVKKELYKYREDLIKKHPTISKEKIDSILDDLATDMAKSWFKEGAIALEPKIASLYYAADRAYNMKGIYDYIDKGINVILDRYIYSNLGHQGGKISDCKEREDLYDWDLYLEYNMLNLPEPDIKIFLHMPTEYVNILKKNRKDDLDEHEKDINHLKNAEESYLQIAKLYNFITIECLKEPEEMVTYTNIKTPEEINKEVYDVVKRKLTL